jgi:hypothetical protein
MTAAGGTCHTGGVMLLDAPHVERLGRAESGRQLAELQRFGMVVEGY